MSWGILIGTLLALAVLGWLRTLGNRQIEKVELPGGGEFEFDIVGESNYQKALSKIVGGKTHDGAEHYTDALIVMEDDNPHDKKAVRVDIESRTVGYFSKEDARSFRKQMKKLGQEDADATCKAVIVGGWDRGRKDKGSFGVKLDLPTED